MIKPHRAGREAVGLEAKRLTDGLGA